MSATLDIDLDLARLTSDYEQDRLTPSVVVEAIFDSIVARGDDGVWISRVAREDALARARALERLSLGERLSLPLWGIPFSVKDCIDVAGLPTTSACPEFSYLPDESNLAVERLLSAGAILIGKTNMDQFATGLVGVRSPYGVARNPFDPAVIPGGSSSGAAVSVAAGLVSFALGTDTGGSGRVPAAFNNVVGLKPTRGLISGVGTVPACRSIETVSIFALTISDAQTVFDLVRHYDRRDPFARAQSPSSLAAPNDAFRFGVPAPRFLDFFGCNEAEKLFQAGIRRLEEIGGIEAEIDYTPFLEINDLLFRGPWLAERYGALSIFVEENPGAILPVTREILRGGREIRGSAVFAAQQRLNLLKRRIDDLWNEIDIFVVPTTGTIFTIAEVEADPINLNAKLGTYTNFVNLADLAAVAVPNGFLSSGVPQGITLIGPAFSDNHVARLAERFHRRLGAPPGARHVRQRDNIFNPKPQLEQVT